MKNVIQIFESPEFGQIRTITSEQGEPLFCLKDVCAALLLDGKQVNRRLEDGVVSKHPIVDSLGRSQFATFVNEDGLYDVILDSRKPEARAFRKWVTSEVLPQIRKTGGYIPVREEDDDQTILCKALAIYKRTIEQKDALLEAQKPLVHFAKAVTQSKGSILIGELAKLLTENGYPTGRTRLFEELRLMGYLFKQSTEPIQKWVEKGLFELSVSLISTNHGDIERVTTRVTGKGQEYFINLFCKGPHPRLSQGEERLRQ